MAGPSRLRVFVMLLAAVSVAPAAGSAQEAPTADAVTLARIAAHIDAARFDSARSQLDEWQATRAAHAREAERASADMLAARLVRDGVAAQHAWIGLALAHPFSAEAGLALLRVGQAAVLQGDTSAAIVYLTRLIDDFSGGGQQPEAHLWLSRAHFIAGHAASACTAARDGLASGASAEVHGLLRLQEERACAGATAAAETGVVAGDYAVQSGAFRARAGADALAARLRAQGLEPRLVRVPGSELTRVRVGTFAARAHAATLRDRLRSSGFDAVVVDDVDREIPVP
ncbi:MAG TPA: SPOR domain-containing protein [Longimicrobiales bacterium]|nr:SPOR domain-containing protein [Longimicrobiales bacterium]